MSVAVIMLELQILLHYAKNYSYVITRTVTRFSINHKSSPY